MRSRFISEIASCDESVIIGLTMETSDLIGTVWRNRNGVAVQALERHELYPRLWRCQVVEASSDVPAYHMREKSTWHLPDDGRDSWGWTRVL